MNTIKFKDVNCKNCYKCIRSCPVKSISMKNEHAQIIDEGCILCGRCLQVCPQNAKSVVSEIDKVKEFLEKKHKVYASIAPSFAPVFKIDNPKVIDSIFKKLGFTYVEETAVGAISVTDEFRGLMQERKMKNIITTCCSSVVSLVEKYYPELIPQLAPVVSPMVAHGKMMKDKYGSRIKVVFIGPCLSKKEEFKDSVNDKIIDAVITFDEFEDTLHEFGIDIEEMKESAKNDENTGSYSMTTRFYPAPGGIIKSVGSFKGLKYKPIKVEGIENCMELLAEIANGEISDYFIEMNSCNHGCLGGPCMKKDTKGFLDIRENLMKYISENNNSSAARPDYNYELDFSREFKNKSTAKVPPDDQHIEKILHKIGKFTKEQELNCGACGYQSCREKAIAVINGKAETYMCLPYMRERAESISNVIIQSTPNAIIALSEDLMIFEANASAQKLFRLMGEEYVNRYIYEFLDCPELYEVKETKKDIINRKYRYDNYDLFVEQSILYIKEHQMILLVMKDITGEIKNQEIFYKLQEETIDVAQKVIEKQMRVAQEIASLLGETTAETKVALTKLKKSIKSEMGEQI